MVFSAPAKTGSDIIERIAESRKQRHESAVEDLHQELGVISSVSLGLSDNFLVLLTLSPYIRKKPQYRYIILRL